jgi:P-type Ca2+ transporter type 2C
VVLGSLCSLHAFCVLVVHVAILAPRLARVRPLRNALRWMGQTANFDVEHAQGLSQAQAAARLLADGPNELASEQRTSLLRTLLEMLREPMILLLLGAGSLYFVLGDVIEALTLLGFVLFVVAIGVVQGRRTEHALTALKGLTSPRALVIRGGKRERIAGREVVREDLIILNEGDRVPADGRVLHQTNLSCDESLLTGESVPVRKSVGMEAKLSRPGGDDQPFVYAGSLVVRGQGVMQVEATGTRSELGKIGSSLASVEVERTALSREVDRIVRIVASAGGLLCLLLFLLVGFTRGDFIAGLLSGIALAMAILPEEFPVVLTVFFALGALRLSKYRVLARRAQTIETLGATTVLCTDKTGTLTENRMRVAHLDTGQLVHRVTAEVLPEEVHELVEVGILASQSDPFDPMEIAFKSLGERDLSGTEHLHETWELLREYPLSSELLSMSHVWRDPHSKVRIIAAKGAPEAIFDLCHLPGAEIARLRTRVEDAARAGLRVLGVAKARLEGAPLPDGQHDFEFQLVGLVGLEDPVRSGVPEAVASCQAAGIRVIMITGDYPATAQAIAQTCGIESGQLPATGPDLTLLDDAALDAQLSNTQVIARAVPELKLRIVRALSRRGEVVAMTGDGVNDAPALKAAQIGIAMGARGTDVAREAAALVVTDDDFASIVAGIRLGRRIFDNLQKAMAYIIAVHVPIAGLSLLPVLVGLPVVLMPVHIVFLELMIDPICSLAFEAEPEEHDVMIRPPRSLGIKLFSRHVLVLSVLQGLSVLIAALGIHAYYIACAQRSAEEARALAFATLTAGNMGLVLVNRSWSESALRRLGSKNVVIWIVAAAAGAALALSLGVKAARDLFDFAPVRPADLAIAATLGFASLLWFELSKLTFPAWLGTHKARAPGQLRT